MPAFEEPFVIHLDDGRQWRGGQHQVALLAEGLAARGRGQVVLTPSGSPLEMRLRSSGVECAPLTCRGEWDWRAPVVLARLALERNARIIHAHTAHAHALAVAAHRRISRIRPGWPGRVVSTRRVDFPVGRGFFSRRKYLYPHQHYIAISRAVRRELIEGGIAASRVSLVASGVPPLDPERLWSRERARGEFGIEPGGKAVVTVGALTDHKGHRWLIEAAPAVFARHPDAGIWILGGGELRGELESLIKSLGVASRVHLCGHVDDARHKLAGFDLYVSSSHLEGLGTAILDAMQAGLPVVAGAAGGVTDIILDGENGLLTAPGDAPALAAGICRMLGATDQDRLRMIGAARGRVAQSFSAEAMVGGTLAVYAEIMNRSE